MLDRRGFLARGAIGAVIAGLAGKFWRQGRRAVVAADIAKASAVMPGKDQRLIVHSAEPVEIETPIELLRQHKITPKEILFVRNNQRLEGSLSLGPLRLDDWTVEIAGLVEFPRLVEGKQLRELPTIEREVVLQCSGNGRTFFSSVAKVKGSPWSRGAMGNVRFKGVPVAELFKVVGCNVSSAAKFLTAEGKDSPLSAAKADFEHSIPLADALSRSFLALEMNGEPIPAVHGGPVRLITPGFYGTMNVKWVNRLRLEAHETTNHNQLKRYRTPTEPIALGSEFDYTLANSEPNWRMRTKSVIFSPLDGERIAAGRAEVSGVAFNDGDTRLDSVLVSIDDGQSWQQAELTTPESPYGWYWWKAQIELPKGERKIRSRAVDALGRSQPTDGSTTWNPDGYAFNGVDVVTVQAT